MTLLVHLLRHDTSCFPRQLFAKLLLPLLLIPAVVQAEGVVQMGLGQDLLDHQGIQAEGHAPDSASASVYVDILAAGEVINVSLCGTSDADAIEVSFYAPSNDSVPVNTQSLASSNVSCSDPMTAPLATPFKYTSLESGTYRLELQNTSQSAWPLSLFKRYDVTVTPNISVSPDPTATDGRLWGYMFSFNANGFGASQSTDANYFAMVPGGRPNTHYVWQLDLNNFAGYGYTLVANSLGVDAPNSGYSAEESTNSVTYQHPMYLGYPAIADAAPTAAPALSGVRFVDDDGQDYAITPGITFGVQDSGTFEFTTDVDGTYSILIDINQDGIYGNAGDRQLLGVTTSGLNQVLWDGSDATGSPTVLGAYFAQVQVHMGEYHFIAKDVETSGGTADGLTVNLAHSNGSFTDTLVYWDDVTLLASGGSSNTPEGALSSTSAGHHTWGNFTETSFGNNRFLDTYVFGLATTAYAAAAVVSDDSLQTNYDGTVTAASNNIPGDPLTINVSDIDLNTNPGTIENVDVEVLNNINGEVEFVTLSETGPNSGVFTASMTTVSGAFAGADNDGTMNTQFGDTMTVIYIDLIAADYTSHIRTTLSTVLPDADGDGIPDNSDLDDDNDGIVDAIEGNVDTDGDGLVDSLDADSDNDGLLDSDEDGLNPPLSGVDSDGDEIDDTVDASITGGADVNGDGVDDAFQPTDTDGDGIADYLDRDSDADGIADMVEALAGALDTDGDGVFDHLDTDSDNDGIDDAVEDSNSPGLLGADTDLDGIDDALDVNITGGSDTNGNGVDDAFEPTDSDGDGRWDHLDVDSDNDGIVDYLEGTADSDGDGSPDYLDPDSDNDGILDSVEDSNSPLLTGSDTDNDGIDDALDVDTVGGSDTNGNGISDSVEPGDSDGDGIPNHLDIDSDGDGISDHSETSGTGTAVDTDGDGIADYLDTDSDNDGLLDSIEDNASPTLTSSDSDNDGIVDAIDVSLTGGVDSNGNGIDDVFEPTDSDGDGTPDHLDIDSDGDGIADIAEAFAGVVDSDGDGISDHLDTDSDNDNISDSEEDTSSPSLLGSDADNDGIDDAIDVDATGGVDADGNGMDDSLEPTDSDNDNIPDHLDIDADNDGIVDIYETAIDTDGDGTPDYLDLDSDNDSLSDSLEDSSSPTLANVDTDNDGIDDALDADLTGGSDTNGNGIDDALEPVNTDGDSLPDHLDTDADGDSIIDLIEAGPNPAAPRDSEGDGVADYLDVDSDNDGVNDADEGNIDTDGDGIVNYLDQDSDNDGLLDITEGNVDTDGDGLFDYQDLDSDGDGIPDLVEGDNNPLGVDTDGDGVLDFRDIDADNDGILDALETALDSDGDGVGDYRDLDSDNDGVTDVVESGTQAVTDFAATQLTGPVGINGLVDAAETSIDSGVMDHDADGIADLPLESDGDSVEDFRDLDSDNDGITDVVESGSSDIDGNGEFDNVVDSNANGLHDGLEATAVADLDSDADGSVDRLDIDSDNDGEFDSIEANLPDADNNGRVDDFTDNDNDGYDDTLSAAAYEEVDSDADGLPDFRDPDSDNDGIVDSIEGDVDTDGDGVIDRLDTDSDNDGIPDVVEAGSPAPVDSDGDGIADYVDLDSDDDGLPDSVEVGADVNSPVDTDNDGLANYLDTDSDNDGIDDRVETNVDTDGDGLPNAIDPDSDNDGIPDALEGGPNDQPQPDADNDGLPDALDIDSDNDGVSDAIEGSGDTDGDGLIDSVDLDSDHDGIPDAVEGSIDTDGDGLIDSLDIDSDNDGLLDRDETVIDSDNDGISDYRDLDSDNDGLTDAFEAGGEDADGDGVIDGFVDINADGWDDGVAIAPLPDDDFDRDGVVDHLDVDSDNDGLTDLTEVTGYVADSDGDGRIDQFVDENGDGLDDAHTLLPVIAEDLDGDGASNHLDLDADGDGVLDLVEAGGVDANGDGVVDTLNDADNDGIPDSVDVDITGGDDADADGIDDTADVDFVSEIDTDGDGIVDSSDPDIDGDGFANVLQLDGGEPLLAAALPDIDDNGTPDVSQANAIGEWHTGIAGSGCSISIASTEPRGVDPLLTLLALLATLCLAVRRRTALARWVGLAIVSLISAGCASVVPRPAEPLQVEQSTQESPLADTDKKETQLEKRHVYAGLGIGISRLEPEARNIEGASVEDTSDTGGQLALGLDINKWLSLELHAADLGRAKLSTGGGIDYRSTGVSALFYAGKNRHNWQRQGLNAFGRIGYGMLDTSGVGDVAVEQDNSSHILFGLGAEYSTRVGLGIRAEYIAFDQDVSYAQLGLIYRSGRRAEQEITSLAEDKQVAKVALAKPEKVPTASVDDDNDGVDDGADQCPATAPKVIVNKVGCALFNDVLEGVNFHPGSAVLTADSETILNGVIKNLKSNPAVAIKISAHTDDQGSSSSNQQLSIKRARAVGIFLVYGGIDKSRLELRAYGESQPIASNQSAEGRRKNRRVEIVPIAL